MPTESVLTPAMPEEQLLLPLQGRPDITLADLPARAFAPVLSALAQLRAGQLREVCIWGAPGAGRSLLLSAFVSEVARDAGQVVLLPLRQVVFMPPEMLDGLESCPLIVLDDIEAVAGWPAWEEGLFNLYNRLLARGGRLLFSACTPPSGLPLQLPDLRSRLARASAHALPAPDDDVLAELLQIAATRRGWQLDADVARYMLERGPRRLGAFMALIERLERRALQERRGITVPLVRSLLD